MTTTEINPNWYEAHANMILLTRWLAERHYSANGIADAVATPWFYGTEFILANEIAIHEQSPGSHVCLNDGTDTEWYCDSDAEGSCQWGLHVVANTRGKVRRTNSDGSRDTITVECDH